MVQEILSAYGLNANQFEVTQISNGLINQTWRVKNSKSEFILQKVNEGVFKNPGAIAANLRMLAVYLAREYPDYLFVAPLQTQQREEMVLLPEGSFRIFPYVKRSHTIHAAQIPQQAFEAAKQFGKFTRLLAHFPIEKLEITLPDFHNLSLRYRQFKDALEYGNKARITKSKELIDFIRKNKNIVETYESILRNPEFKLRVTHHDTKISNVLFNEDDKGLCVIDLDTVMPGYFISDVGDMMRTYLSPVSEEEKDFGKIQIREDFFNAIREGYMSEMEDELTSEEKKHFVYAGKFMIYMQAIRFLTDHISNDTYYGAKYRDHNFIRAGNQIVLLQQLIKNENNFAL